MKDFDFEELDQMINSVFDQNDAQPAAPTKGEDSPASTPPPAAPVAQPETPRTDSPAARRSSGRFMDMIHPSSDMQNASRPVAPRPESTQTGNTAPVMAAAASVEPPKPVTPAESPFISDAVVEKRPLGAASPTGALAEVPMQELLDKGEEMPLLEATTEDTSTPISNSFEQVASEPAPAPLYDTETHGPVMAAAPKKKSGLLVALFVFLLIVLGAGAGAGVYFFVLPLL